jgi:hypothetical protein
MKKYFTGTSGKIMLHVLAWTIIIVLPQYLNRRYLAITILLHGGFMLIQPHIL